MRLLGDAAGDAAELTGHAHATLGTGLSIERLATFSRVRSWLASVEGRRQLYPGAATRTMNPGSAHIVWCARGAAWMQCASAAAALALMVFETTHAERKAFHDTAVRHGALSASGHSTMHVCSHMQPYAKKETLRPNPNNAPPSKPGTLRT